MHIHFGVEWFQKTRYVQESVAYKKLCETRFSIFFKRFFNVVQNRREISKTRVIFTSFNNTYDLTIHQNLVFYFIQT